MHLQNHLLFAKILAYLINLNTIFFCSVVYVGGEWQSSRPFFCNLAKVVLKIPKLKKLDWLPILSNIQFVITEVLVN
jgi:hypothetical protein